MSNLGSMDSIFSAFVQGDNIFWTNGFSENKKCGITNASAMRLEDALEKAIAKGEEYKSILIEAGIIQREKTPEEIAREAMDTARTANENAAKMAALLESATVTIERLAKKVDDLELLSIQTPPATAAASPAPVLEQKPSTEMPQRPISPTHNGGKK